MNKLSQFGLVLAFLNAFCIVFLLAITFLGMVFFAPSIPERIISFLMFALFAGCTLFGLSVVTKEIKDFFEMK